MARALPALLYLLSHSALLSCIQGESDKTPILTNIIPEYSNGDMLSSRTSSFPFHAINEFRPKIKQMKTKKLLRRLGDDFDEQWMSIEEPTGNLLPEYTHEIKGQLLTDFQPLEQELMQGKMFSNMNNETMQAVKMWLLKRASCQMQHHWEDLGTLFWPRYVKSGTCVSHGSCSWPPGMRCVISENKTIKILRWHCKLRRRKKHRESNKSRSKRFLTQKTTVYRRLKCKWTRIPHYVTDGCFCSC